VFLDRTRVTDHVRWVLRSADDRKRMSYRTPTWSPLHERFSGTSSSVATRGPLSDMFLACFCGSGSCT
jgi:hypothetical protein